MCKRLWYILFFICGCAANPGQLFAQEEFSIDLIDVKKGLLSNFVTKTISDNKQLKYFATEAGISRYDGYGFKHYRPTIESNGLVNENIETLFPSKSGHIWIGTKTGGLSRLNVRTQTIENWNDVFTDYTSKLLRIVSIAEDMKGNLWVGTYSMGCFKVNAETKKVVEHFPSNRTIFNIICDSKGTIWFTDGWDLCAYRNEEGSLQRYMQSFNLYNICEDTARKRIWFLGNQGLNVRLGWLDPMQGTVTEVPTNLSGRFASSLAIDSKNRIWIGSWGNGLHVSDPAVTQFHKINTSDFSGSMRNVNHNAITHIYIDTNGIAWLSTSYGGVLILYPNKGFRNIANNEDSEWRDYNVTALHGNGDNKVLVGSIAKGLFDAGDPLRPKFVHNSFVPASRINQIFNYNEHYFIGSREGLFVFSQGLQRPPKTYFPLEKITSIAVTGGKKLWLGTQEHGLFQMNLAGEPDTAGMITYNEHGEGVFRIENNRINKIIQDEKENLWVATHSGINFRHAATGEFISHSELFANKFAGTIVHDILLAGKHMYLATPNGLYKIAISQNTSANPTLEVVEHYTEKKGLVNQFICALQQDRNNNIWFSTTKGISRLNSHTGVIHHFGKQEGVQINAFHITSSYRDVSGALYFGGDNGFVYFNPEVVVANYAKPTLVLTGLNINNIPVEVNSKDKGKNSLTEAIQYTETILLDHKHNHISVQFAANDFLGTENIDYAYKLTPGDKNWVSLKDKNELIFTGLKPGNYELSIRANRNNQGWGTPTVVQVKISYPPWLSWYAIILYVFLMTGIIWAIREFRLHQEKLKLELQRVQFEKEKEHEINEAKINFFTNISHEFRTPLTLILSPCTELLSSGTLAAPETQKISLVKSNAQKLLRLINQLLDFRKSEHGLLSLHTQQEDIRKLARSIVNDFAPAAKSKNISLSFVCEAAEIMADIDKPQFEMAINNLVSNAIKFTPANGVVLVKLSANHQLFSLQVIDNGIGIDALHLDKVFNRFYQVPSNKNHQAGSGIGLAFAKNIVELHKGTISLDSMQGKGTTFTIEMPLRQLNGRVSDSISDEMESDKVIQSSLAPGSTNGHHSPLKPKILVVDDSDDIRLYLSGLLKDEFEVFEADNGSSGHKLAIETMPDLIISDVMMPQMDGIELCSELKNNIATSHIPIILLTARASEAFELSGLQTGADDYITKPFNPMIVQMRVRNMLENRNKLKAYYLKKVRFEPDTEVAVAENLDEVFLRKAIDLVNANMQNENLGIEMMVDQLFMSQSTLFRKIKSLTGLSITGFIRALRVKKAAQLILQSNMKMSDVAYEVGFNDYKYFKKSFQQQFGCLPSEYREKQAEDLPK
jgi:signal transduction histidine kinase/ligand-binding sensor domain-containing protein/DNA-binding response OmpR family regulator